MILSFDATSAEETDSFSTEWSRMAGLCARITGDPVAAEDLAQETMLIALQQESMLRDPEKRSQWLSGIARNLCKYWLRSRGRCLPSREERGCSS